MLFDFKAIIPETKSQYPYLNESTAVMDFMTTRPKATFDNLDFWIERTPEALAIINAIVTDIKADGFRFEGGKQAVNRATNFSRVNFFGDEHYKTLWDWVKYGDAYLWIGGVESLLKVQKKFNIELGIDEDFPKAIRSIPANTVDILHNNKIITGFTQTSQGREKINFSVKDVIHGPLIPNKGKVYGISPSQAALTEMNILGYLKDFVGTYFKNGGVPDWMFVLPNEMAGSPNHKRLITMLQKYKHPERKHGNLVFAGEVEPTQIGAGLDKIAINELAIYFTSVFALAHNMPVSRVAAIIGAEVKVSSGGDDLANEGYWSKIAEHQDRWETWLNTQLWKPYFDVEIRFNRAWKTNEIKEQQRNQFAIGNIRELNNQLMRYDQQINLEYIKRQLYIRDNDLEKVNDEFKRMAMDNMMGIPGQDNKGGKQPDNKERDRGAANQSFRDQKKKEQEKTGAKSKITHNVSRELFFEKFNMFVRQSETRNLYYYFNNEVLYATISLPDENFNLEIALAGLNPSEIGEIMQFGEQTQGIK